MRHAHYYGLQFHPEVTHTRQGMAILQRFVCEIAGCDTLWTADNIITDAIADIRARVGADEVLLALSGGVDSAVDRSVVTAGHWRSVDLYLRRYRPVAPQ